jgi:bifunctional DNA-binding transcriptional regulator/antitoxin component of YhaV-PrlF toxin-antitoxin module
MKITSKGQVTIPIEIRERLGLDYIYSTSVTVASAGK